MPETLDTLNARLDSLLSDAYDAWSAALWTPEEAALAALHDGLQKTVWRVRATGAAPKSSADELPLFTGAPT